MTHSDIKLVLDHEDDEIRRAQNKTSSDRVWEYASPSTCSLELDLQVQTEYQAIDTCDRAFTCRFESNVIRKYLPYKTPVNTTPMNSNTRGGGAIDLFGCRYLVDSTAVAGRRISSFSRHLMCFKTATVNVTPKINRDGTSHAMTKTPKVPKILG